MNCCPESLRPLAAIMKREFPFGLNGWCPFAVLTVLLLAPLTARAAPANVTVSAPVFNLANTWLLDTDPANDTIRFSLAVSLSRNQPLGGVRDIPVVFRTRLRTAGGTTTVGSAEQIVVVSVPAVVANLQVAVNLEFDPTVILSEDQPYEIFILVQHNDDPPGSLLQTDHTLTISPLTFGHFSGGLVAGGVDGTITTLSAAPLKLLGDQAWRLVVQSGLLENGSAFSSGAPATAFINVLRDDATGVVTLTSGSLNVTGGGGPTDVNGWQVTLGPVVLGTGGLNAQGFTLRLPEGTGWRFHDADPNTSQLLTSSISSATGLLPLNGSLQPTAGFTDSSNVPREFVDERLAVGFVATGWQWDLFHLRLTQPATRFLRAWYFEQWKDPGVKGELPDTNDGFWDRLNASTTGDLLIAPGPTGGFHATLTFANGVFSTHFPHGFVAHTGGTLVLADSRPLTAQSAFPIATTTIITYRGCRPGEDPHALPDAALREAVQVGPGSLRFTAHGGLWTEGIPVSDPNPNDDIVIVRRAAAGIDPNSGLPVHQTGSYSAQNVQLLVPGPVVSEGDGFNQAGGQPAEFNPARWLYTGLRPAENDALEHPGTAEYFAGAADYAGVNFRGYAGLRGISRVGGGVLGPYQLDLCQKLYARSSGITGRWVADANTLPPSVQVGGPEPFTITIDEWSFQLVGNEPQFEFSNVAGGVDLPHPADFELAFASMEFKCCGALDRVSLAAGTTVKEMAYWQQARIDIQSARFVTAEECSMNDAGLELGVRARVNGFPNDLDGVLIFRGNGRLTRGDEVSLAASALHIPTDSPFAGDYVLTGVRHAYYNDPPNPLPAEDNGWINVAGLLNLPFFEAMEVHALLNGRENTPFHPDVIPGLQGGWTSGGDQTFFNHALFDAVHRGLPPAFNTPAAYLNNTDEDYLPRAEKTWFGVVPFDFPVRYDAFTRTLHSVQKKEINIIIAEAEADVPRLDAEEAAIEFGATFGLSLNNIFANALDFATGEIVEGFGNLAIGPAFQSIDEGLDELDNVLSQQLDHALDAALDPIFTGELILAAAEQVRDAQDVVGALNEIDFDLELREVLAVAVAENVIERLGPIGEGLNGMRSFLASGEAAEDNQIGQLMQQAMGYLNLPPGFNLASVSELVQLAGVDTGPLRDRLDELGARMEELRELVQDITGLDGELVDLFQNVEAEFAGLQADIRDSLEDYFEMVAQEPASFSLEEVQTRIRSEIKARIYSLPVMSQVQDVLRFRFYHLDHLIQQVLAAALDQINDAITDAVAEVVDLDGTLGELTGIGNYLQAASLKGEAVITGNDLTFLSLRGHTVIHTQPVAIAFDPFYEYQQLHSDGAGSCNAGLTPVIYNRITMGATVAPANVPFGNVNVTVATQFSFTADGFPIGFKGSIETLADGLSMQPVNFDRMSATLAVGSNQGGGEFEFYLAAEAEATLFGSSGPIAPPYSNFKLHGGLFAGRTCSDLPYAAWAPQIIQNELEPPFVGAIVSVDGKFPFYDVGCLLRIKAGAAVGAYGVVQSDPDDYDNLGFAVGSFMRGEVSGDFLCLLSGSGAIELSGSASQSGVTLTGAVETKLKLGPCPFCLKLESEFGVTLNTASNPSISVDF